MILIETHIKLRIFELVAIMIEDCDSFYFIVKLNKLVQMEMVEERIS